MFSRQYGCNPGGLRILILAALERAAGDRLDAIEWGSSAYEPTPTIIEAAQPFTRNIPWRQLPAMMQERIILRVTLQRIEALVDEARQNQRKIIVFVTGVPGAGKTLLA